MSNIPSQLKLNFQDEFFVYLDRILVPIKGVEFEQMALDTAFFIAHEYGSKLDFLHIGKTRKPFFEKYFDKLAKYEIDFDMKIVKKQNIPKAIIELNDGTYFKINSRITVRKGEKPVIGFLSNKSDAYEELVVPHIDRALAKKIFNRTWLRKTTARRQRRPGSPRPN